MYFWHERCMYENRLAMLQAANQNVNDRVTISNRSTLTYVPAELAILRTCVRTSSTARGFTSGTDICLYIYITYMTVCRRTDGTQLINGKVYNSVYLVFMITSAVQAMLFFYIWICVFICVCCVLFWWYCEVLTTTPHVFVYVMRIHLKIVLCFCYSYVLSH